MIWLNLTHLYLYSHVSLISHSNEIRRNWVHLSQVSLWWKDRGSPIPRDPRGEDMISRLNAKRSLAVNLSVYKFDSARWWRSRRSPTGSGVECTRRSLGWFGLFFRKNRKILNFLIDFNCPITTQFILMSDTNKLVKLKANFINCPHPFKWENWLSPLSLVHVIVSGPNWCVGLPSASCLDLTNLLSFDHRLLRVCGSIGIASLSLAKW